MQCAQICGWQQFLSLFVLAGVPYSVCTNETKLSWPCIAGTIRGCSFGFIFTTDISVTAGRRASGYGVLCTVFCIISFFFSVRLCKVYI